MALLKSEAYSRIFYFLTNAIHFRLRRMIRIERTTETHYLYTVIWEDTQLCATEIEIHKQVFAPNYLTGVYRVAYEPIIIAEDKAILLRVKIFGVWVWLDVVFVLFTLMA